MHYYINGVEYSYESITNNNILKKLVEREVYCCMTSEIEFLLTNIHLHDNPISEADFLYSYESICEECGSIDDFRECSEDETSYICNVCGKVYSEEEYNNLDSHYPEIFEWWAVTSWFGEKLKAAGQPVIECWGKSYWGRTTTGQAIHCDGCIHKIAEDMQILEGMAYSWEDRI